MCNESITPFVKLCFTRRPFVVDRRGGVLRGNLDTTHQDWVVNTEGSRWVGTVDEGRRYEGEGSDEYIRMNRFGFDHVRGGRNTRSSSNRTGKGRLIIQFGIL